MDNKELIDKIEKIGFEYVNLFKEAFIRKINGNLSEEEFDKIGDFSLKGTSLILDIIPSDKMNKKSIQDRMIEGLNKCMDENR